ncbi:MAG: methyltransferase domain-containing protein [Rhodoglobus sp.]
MDLDTSEFYARNASDVVARYEAANSPLIPYLRLAFPASSRVLDVGCGSGRDLALLLREGYDAFGIEPVDAMRLEAIRRHPELASRISAAALPNIELTADGQFDGVICSAVLMHVPEHDLFDTVFNLRSLLRPHGRLLMSLPLTRDDVLSGERSTDGRLFKTYTPDYLQLLLERTGFQQIGRWETEDALGRTGTTWFTQLFELRSAGLTRAVDQIEGILNRDLKVATYKLALFRALSELATQEPRVATWRSDGRVGVPLRRVAEKWLVYYWPIFAAARFVPQSSAEGAESSKQLLFRKPMLALMAPYVGRGEHGGLGAWQLDQNAGRIGTTQAALQETALRSIGKAIRQGPVAFSGGALETGQVFAFDSASAQVLMAADLWRELSLLGHWINDAVILRWAELSERFGVRQGIHAGDVLPLLMAKPEPLRATAVARDVFARSGWTHCAWTDRKLTNGFVVDHIIPFSLWGNNDLWNLLPADPGVNGQKSDKLPTSALLNRQRDKIGGAWRLLRDAVPIPFDRQATHLLGGVMGSGNGWEDSLFARLREAVEITALQRGMARWSPTPPAPRPASLAA